MDATVVSLDQYRKPFQPMSKRSYEASMKDIISRIAKQEVSPADGWQLINDLQNEYFFPE